MRDKFLHYGNDNKRKMCFIVIKKKDHKGLYTIAKYNFFFSSSVLYLG